MELIISGNNKKYLDQVEKLARRLGLSVQKPEKKDKGQQKESRSKALYELMTRKADSGGIESIQDPIAWQNEVREDKKLYGRDE